MTNGVETNLQRLAEDGRHGKPALRLLTCGAVDDGKSTLIGRLLFEQNTIADEISATAPDVDFANLLRRLEAERQRGGADAAYRHFSTPRRSFVVADPPGDERLTRQALACASNADLIIVSIDARKGLLPPARRHIIVAWLLGVRHIVLAVNKIDLVDFSEKGFLSVATEFGSLAASLGFASILALPVSGRLGDNVCAKSPRTPWYQGPDLKSYIENLDVADMRCCRPFRMSVQSVCDAQPDSYGFSGTIASGSVKPGDEVVVASSGRRAIVDRIVAAEGPLACATTGDAVTLTLSADVDVARGDILASSLGPPKVADHFAAHIIWINDQTLLPNRSYLLEIGTLTVPATVTELKYKLDIDTLVKAAAKTLALNDVGFGNVATSVPIAFDPHSSNRDTGAFVLLDSCSRETVAVGTIAFGLRRATNVTRQALSVGKAVRAQLKRQRPAVLWFTGLSGAGKSTIANCVETQLVARRAHTIMLDGDNLRHGLNKDLGFSEADRVENIRRVGEVAKLMTDAGLIVLCSFISPFRAERRFVRELVGAGEFVEIFVDTPLEVCMARDPKGLYGRALAGEIKNFTGVDQVYERPENSEIIIGRQGETADEAADRIVRDLIVRGIVDES